MVGVVETWISDEPKAKAMRWALVEFDGCQQWVFDSGNWVIGEPLGLALRGDVAGDDNTYEGLVEAEAARLVRFCVRGANLGDMRLEACSYDEPIIGWADGFRLTTWADVTAAAQSMWGPTTLVAKLAGNPRDRSEWLTARGWQKELES